MTQSVVRIPTDRDDLYAFEIHGEVQSDDMQDMAEMMNDAFDEHDKVDMLLMFKPYDGAETGATFDTEVLESRFRALSNVNKYVVVGAPERANSILNFMDKLIPVDAATFEPHEAHAAWSYVDAKPLDAARTTV